MSSCLTLPTVLRGVSGVVFLDCSFSKYAVDNVHESRLIICSKNVFAVLARTRYPPTFYVSQGKKTCMSFLHSNRYLPRKDVMSECVILKPDMRKWKRNMLEIYIKIIPCCSLIAVNKTTKIRSQDFFFWSPKDKRIKQYFYVLHVVSISLHFYV